MRKKLNDIIFLKRNIFLYLFNFSYRAFSLTSGSMMESPNRDDVRAFQLENILKECEKCFFSGIKFSSYRSGETSRGKWFKTSKNQQFVCEQVFSCEQLFLSDKFRGNTKKRAAKIFLLLFNCLRSRRVAKRKGIRREYRIREILVFINWTKKIRDKQSISFSSLVQNVLRNLLQT